MPQHRRTLQQLARALLILPALLALPALMSACGGGSGASPAVTPPVGNPPLVTPPVVTPPVVPPPVVLPAYVDPGPAGLTLLAGGFDARTIIDGSGVAAHFSYIRDICPDNAGNYYVADEEIGVRTPGASQSLSRRAVRKVSASGVVTTVYSSRYESDVREEGSNIYALAPATDGGVYVLEPHGGKRLLRIAANGDASVVLSGEAELGKLRDLVPAPNGGVYLLYTQSIRLLDAKGGSTLLAGNDSNPDALNVDGQGGAARFAYIASGSLTRQGDLLVWSGRGDGDGVRRVTAGGVVSTLPAIQLPAFTLGETTVTSVIADANGGLYSLLLGRQHYWIYQVSADRQLSEVISADMVQDSFSNNPGSPVGLASGSDGKLLLHSLAELRLVSGKQALPFAGLQNSWGMDLDATGAAARFAAPDLLAGDRTGNTYVIDHPGAFINPIVGEAGGLYLRKVAPDGRVSTLKVAPAMKILTAMVSDTAGNLYLSERSFSSYHTPSYGGGIHKITPDGSITLLAGEASPQGSFNASVVDGVGSAARFAWPIVVGVDADGNVYAKDSAAKPFRKIAPDGTTTSLDALPSGLGLAPDGQRYELTDTGVARVAADGSKTEVASFASLPPGAAKPRAIASTGQNSLSLLVGEAIFKLVLPR
jgi:hypothetical protein